MNSVSANVNNQGIALGSKSSLRAHYTGKTKAAVMDNAKAPRPALPEWVIKRACVGTV